MANVAREAQTKADLQAISCFYGLSSKGRGECPVHGGKSGTSFSVSVGRNGNLLLRCFDDCTYRSIYDQIADDGLLPARTWDIPEEVREVELATKAASWVGRGKATEQAVLLAHIALARNCCRNPYGAAVRETAERAKVQQPITVSRAQKRLEHAGWLEKVESARVKDGIAAVWRLCLPHNPVRSSVTHSPFPNKERRMCYLDRTPFSMAHAELFRYGAGLSRTAGGVYGGILGLGPITARQLAKHLGYKAKRSVELIIKRLASHGLIAPYAKGYPSGAVFWWFGPKSEFEVAAELGLLGETQRQHDRHAEQREARRMQLKLRDPKIAKVMPDSSVVDVTTGELLIDSNGNPGNTAPRSEAPSGYVAVGRDGTGAIAQFLKKLGGREIEINGRKALVAPEGLGGHHDQTHKHVA
jgi:DNA-binding MarR family transcriptional regulator